MSQPPSFRSVIKVQEQDEIMLERSEDKGDANSSKHKESAMRSKSDVPQSPGMLT